MARTRGREEDQVGSWHPKKEDSNPAHPEISNKRPPRNPLPNSNFQLQLSRIRMDSPQCEKQFLCLLIAKPAQRPRWDLKPEYTWELMAAPPSCERLPKSIRRRKGRVMARWRCEKVAYHSRGATRLRWKIGWRELQRKSGDGGHNDAPRFAWASET